MTVLSVPERRLARVKGRARSTCEKPAVGKWREERKAQFSPLPGRPNERRRSSRVAVRSEILLRRLSAFSLNVPMTDISPGGCRVEMPVPTVAGDPVVTRLPQLEPLGARVCWTSGATTGIAFLKTIHPAVFDMLLERIANGETVEPPAVR